MLNILILILIFVLLRVLLFKNIKQRRISNIKDEQNNMIVDIDEEDLIIEIENQQGASNNLDDDMS